jgi:hypothetical protein
MGKVLHASGSGYFPNCINNPDVIATNTVSLTAINGSNSSQSVPTATYRITVIGY